MDKLFNWIKKHKATSVLVIIGLFIIPIIVVHLLFKWKSNIEFIQAEWEAGDILAYIGGFYAFLGTVIFSMLTLWQNDVIDKKNDDYNNKLLEIETTLNIPHFDIPYTSGSGQGCNGNYTNYKFKLRNISPNTAIFLNVSNFSVFDETGNKTVTSKSVEIDNTVLFAQSSINIIFKNDGLNGKNLTLIFYIEYKDKYYNAHKVKATGYIKDAQNFQPVIFDLIEMEDTHNANT